MAGSTSRLTTSPEARLRHIVEQEADHRVRLLRHRRAQVREQQRLQDRRLDNQPDDEDDAGGDAAPKRHVPAVIARHRVELAEIAASRAERPAAAEVEADDRQRQDRNEEDGELHAVGRPCTLRPVERALVSDYERAGSGISQFRYDFVTATSDDSSALPLAVSLAGCAAPSSAASSTTAAGCR